ncbi:N-acetylglucosaminyl-phosphatidylinositol de-N-acetylase isoform X2 [Callorhinchus milii]|uniref:N-acetylglucosaminyl-phosphatidylinositol de-N-acetylase isoform X2 n=1 Tax=Callorhinchus milii TaxID=7868 RepID=UPI0004572F3B|nr:N-acetylglucosaminyl-phosphatidylinositol de-N-acetylase isoform X2 [Callorhinchus milii]|eukprot:gi/632957759/ref/XP_007894660.1/ PREDICTED: N-acetylglucosaminyl-phosphatidylinositol de-N-acetylase [Callorhinchus milii]
METPGLAGAGLLAAALCLGLSLWMRKISGEIRGRERQRLGLWLAPAAGEGEGAAAGGGLSPPVTGGLRPALLVIAHPDDECMFFAPAAVRLVGCGVPVRVLCLSAGNFYNQGEIRKKELLESCGALGISLSHITVLDHRDLPDHPRVQWDRDLVSSLILRYIQSHHIGLVLTFDEGGVSGHVNHIAVYYAVRKLCSERKLPVGCRVLVLESTNIIRKYISILDLPISWLRPHDMIYILSSEEYQQARNAMLCHRSQLLWFRHIYLRISRYMLINTLNQIS